MRNKKATKLVVHGSEYLEKFITNLASCGAKNKIEAVIYKAFFLLKKYTKLNAEFYFYECLEKLKPISGLSLYTQKKKKMQKINGRVKILQENFCYGKANYWLATSVKVRKKLPLSNQLAIELFDNATKGIGVAFAKKKEYYKTSVLFKRNSKKKIQKKFKWKK